MSERTIGSLFAGIGGLEKGLERAGLGRVVFQVEIEPFCRSVLAKHWPNVNRSVCDVRQANAKTLPRVDVLCGGAPCTDLSVAGKQRGLDGEHSGLWYEYARIVHELRPDIVVVENVAHGRGKWLPYVRGHLQALGYRSSTHVLSCGDLGAPHERRRCFVTAYSDRVTLRKRTERVPGRWSRSVRRERQGLDVDASASWQPAGASAWRAFPALPRVDDGFPAGLGRDVRDQERALGNAVSPQVAELVGRIARWEMGEIDE